MAYRIITQSQTFTVTGIGTPFPLIPQPPTPAVPGVFCFLSAGASITYTVEITADDVTVPGYVPASGHWIPLETMTALTASAAAALGMTTQGIRVNATVVSGTLTFSLVQPNYLT